MKIRRMVPVAALVAGTVVLAVPTPAGAAVSVTSAGTTINVSLSGAETVSFRCTSGTVRVVNTTSTFTPSPAVTCAALTQVTITGDSGIQVVDASGLNASTFTAKPKLNVALGDGGDTLTETQNADTIDMGPGGDDLFLRKGLAANPSIDMGSSNFDRVTLVGSDADDALTVASTGANTTLAHGVTGSPAFVWVVKNVEYVDVDGGKGNDALDASSVSAASVIGLTDLDGEDGNDTLTAGARPSRMNGGSGTNAFTGGVAADEIETESDTGTIPGPIDGVDDRIDDEPSLRFGGRSITGFANTVAATDTLFAGAVNNDLSARVRPAAGGSALVTFALNRMGQQALPAGIDEIYVTTITMSSLTPRLLVDVVVPAQDVQVQSTEGEREAIDITVPTGSWTDTIDGFDRVITTSSSAVGDVRLPNDATYRVHGPWANQNQGFGHRVYRDLLLRFASTAERDAVRDQLTNGTRTRAQVAAAIVNTDEYRGVDVDRVFLRYLRRASDPSGRTYWIGSIRNGKSLRQFRAQLFGSNEYFTKAGGTNAGFVARAYEDVLGRKPDPSGQAYWTNKANSGTERGLIARQFLSSPEAKRTIVRDQFLRFLDRQPTQTELDTWVPVLDQTNGEQALVSFLAASAAYFNRT